MFRTSRLILVCALCAVAGPWLSGCTSRVEEKTTRPETRSADAKDKISSDETKPAAEKTPPAEAKGAVVEKGLWQTDFEAAKIKAKAENKLLLVDFTGSDWCGWCIKLKQEVFDKETFKTDAPKQFVCVELDFPQNKELSKELKEQNAKLSDQYKVPGFPTVLVMDPEGEVIARTGYLPGGPEAYVKQLGDFVKTYEKVVALKPQVEKVKGLDRAKLLDQLVNAYDKLGNESDDVAKWSAEIVTLDNENKAGLKPKYEFRVLMAKAVKLMANKKFDEAKAAFDKALAVSPITPEQKQYACMAQGEAFFHLNDFAGLVACLKKAQEAAPNGPRAAQIKQMLERFKDIGQMQEAVAKIKAQLEKATGIERAKLLDQLIDAQGKLNNSPVGRAPPAELAKLSKEIIALDADNKAGLKQKHEIRVALADAMGLAAEGKAVEAGAVIDKILATPDLPPDQLQELQCARGNCYLRAGEAPKGLECLKKAIKAAPQGRLVPALTNMIRFCEERIEKEKQQAGQQPKQEPKTESPAKDEPKTKQPQQ
jgi:thioredoxin-related protein